MESKLNTVNHQPRFYILEDALQSKPFCVLDRLDPSFPVKWLTQIHAQCRANLLNANLVRDAAPELLAALRTCVHLAEREMLRNQSTEFDTGSTARYESVVAAIALAMEGK